MATAPQPTLEQLDRAHLIHPITELRIHEVKGPRVIVGGKGIRLETADGRSIIDGFSGLFNINVGHGRTEIADAVAEQMRKMPYYPSFWDFSNEPAIRLGERLAGLFPADRELDHFLFTTGGSDANETNFRTARLYHAVRGDHERKKVLSRRWSYHGITRAAGSATTLPAYHAFYEPEPNFVPTSMPYCFRCEFKKNPPDCDLLCANDVEEVIKREGPETVAAVIAEPVQGTGGILVPPPDYFEGLREICDRHGVLLIFDEVVSGFGRLGTMFGYEHWKVQADIYTFAKGLASGYMPIGATVVKEHIFEKFEGAPSEMKHFRQINTFGGHPVASAVALKAIQIVEEEKLAENADTVGTYMRHKFMELLADHPYVGEIRGKGMIMGIELVADRKTKAPLSDDKVMGIVGACVQKGVILGRNSNTIPGRCNVLLIAPPLILTKAQADRIVETVTTAMAMAIQK